MWNSATDELLGRIDPYIGVNIDLGGTVRNLDAEVARLKEEEQRRLTPSGDVQERFEQEEGTGGA